MEREPKGIKPPQTMGEFFKARAEELGLTQTQVADKSGFTPGVISKIFSGRIATPGATHTINICKALGMGLEDLFPLFPTPEDQLSKILRDLPHEFTQAVEKTQPKPKEKQYLVKFLNSLKESGNQTK